MKITKFKQLDENKEKFDFDFDEDIEKLYSDTKKEDIFNKLVFSLAFTTTISSVLIALGIPAVLCFSITIPVLTPLSYIGITHFKQKSDRALAASLQEVNQLAKGLTEIEEFDHKIDKNSVCFYHEIASKTELANLSTDIINNINQFLFMINSNYYELITKNFSSLRRDELVDKILNQIINVVMENEIGEFTTVEAKKVLDSCFFIEEKLKKAIIKEFKESEFKIDGHKSYHILSENFDLSKSDDENIQELDERMYSDEHFLRTFDVNDISWYEKMLKYGSEANNNTYGNYYDVEWDLEALRDIMSFMLSNFRWKFIDAKGDYYNSEVVISFIHNVFVYAKVNNRDKVGINEIIQTFKNWNFFEGLFALKLEVLDAIFANFNLDYSMHPYRSKQIKEEKGKILKFPGSKD